VNTTINEKSCLVRFYNTSYKPLLERDEIDVLEFLEKNVKSNSSKNTYLGIIKNFYAWCDSHLPVPLERDELKLILTIKQRISRIRAIKRFREEESKKKKFLNEEEISKLLFLSKSFSRPAFIWTYLLLYSGMRKGEIIKITKKNIKKDYIELTPDITKTKRTRKIFLDDYTEKLLKNNISIIEKKVSSYSLNQLFKVFSNSLGFPLYPHMLRHTFVSQFGKVVSSLPSKLEIDGKVYTLNKEALKRELVGHSPRTTTEIYEHVEENIIKEVMTKYHYLYSIKYERL